MMQPSAAPQYAHHSSEKGGMNPPSGSGVVQLQWNVLLGKSRPLSASCRNGLSFIIPQRLAASA
eukprot:COSAG02_NODE_6708_length_3407_cov_3.645103_8_plen_64_part_00